MSDTSTWPEHEIPNPQVRAAADQIADAAIFLWENVQRINCVPSILLEATFAIELYLKALCSRTVSHANDGMPGFQLTAAPMVRTHRLQEIFDGIEEPIRDELQTAYAAVAPGAPPLRDVLAPYNDLFVEIRYYFERREGGGTNISLLVDLVSFFRDQVGKMPKRYRE